jgi:type II secretory ATPase GspE/PulE/Tfp pilus assembly ATPase PilB-like protein
VAQRLARRICPRCVEPYAPTVDELRQMGLPESHGELTLYRGTGCHECGDTGYRGRVALFEVMPMTDEIASLVGAPTREIQAMAVRQGMFTLREDGIRQSIAGVTTLDEVRRVAGDAAH